MSAISNIDGRAIIWDNKRGVWLYVDTKELVPNQEVFISMFEWHRLMAFEDMFMRLSLTGMKNHVYPSMQTEGGRLADFIYENFEEETLTAFYNQLVKRYQAT